MLDFFSIFSKGGIVLWYFQGTSQLFTQPINALIKSVILQVRHLCDGKGIANHVTYGTWLSRYHVVANQVLVWLNYMLPGNHEICLSGSFIKAYEIFKFFYITDLSMIFLSCNCVLLPPPLTFHTSWSILIWGLVWH